MMSKALAAPVMDSRLAAKYDVPAPRYTSYPTVPYWQDSPSTTEWLQFLRTALNNAPAWSLYLHVPYCETLCTFCGCNTSIGKDHSKEEPYVAALLKEMAAYRAQLPELAHAPLSELHLGGGTPTFLSESNLARLIDGLLAGQKLDAFDGSIEVDPRRTRDTQLKVLRERGFRRVSLGVQDFDPEVQRLINRVQPRETVERITQVARDLGYDSVNFDLVYGLPGQSPRSMAALTQATLELRPDRIALYSFAKVPWIKPAHRLYKDEDIPEGAAKRELYEIARMQLEAGGYVEIGMDHFALPGERLHRSLVEGKIHRNFQGYTEKRTDILLGLGVSSISDSRNCFHQNEKNVTQYLARVEKGEIPTLRGHKLSSEDLAVREQILRLMTRWETEIAPTEEAPLRERLKPMLQDGLVEIKNGKLQMSSEGRPFLRNACMALDRRLLAKEPQTRVFSQSL